jgi:hypothetical protein
LVALPVTHRPLRFQALLTPEGNRRAAAHTPSGKLLTDNAHTTPGCAPTDAAAWLRHDDGMSATPPEQTDPISPPAGDPDGAHATSFGTFKPVGHVMLGLPDRPSLLALKSELANAAGPGYAAEELTPTESTQEMLALIENASPLAGFGYEMTLMRRYVALAQKGYSWLVVKVNSDEEAADLANRAKARGATLAVRYGHLTVEDLI